MQADLYNQAADRAIKMEDIKTKFNWASLIPIAADVACHFLHG